VKIAVMTVSDTRDEASDTSGATLIARLQAAGHVLADRAIVADEQPLIEAKLREWIAADDVEVALLTGGTGLTGRDVTPEAVNAVATKSIPGFGELFRHLSYAKIGTSTVQSRALGAVAHSTLVFALPGSTGACKDGWDMILQYQLDVRYRPCNFVEMLSRLAE
jgi:molybdopterin adenylyltransferase